MILVTGATGNVGSAVVAELSARGIPCRAFVRDPGQAAERLGPDVALAVGDFNDAASLARAMEGADAIFLSSADHPGKVGHETAVIDVAVAAGVRKIVKASTVAAEIGSPRPPFDWNARIEKHLRESAVESVVLQSYFYMTNLLASAATVAKRGMLIAPLGGAKIAMIDPRDTGATGAVALTTGDYDGSTLTLSGPEAVTYDEVAKELASAIGGTVEFVPVPDEAARQSFEQMGLPAWLVTHFAHLFPFLRDGAQAQPTDTVRAVTGREPRGVATWVRDHAALFRA